MCIVMGITLSFILTKIEERKNKKKEKTGVEIVMDSTNRNDVKGNFKSH